MISKLKIIIPVILLMVLVGACTTTATLTNTPTPTATSTAHPTTTPGGTPLSALPSVADVVAKVMPAVAYVSVDYTATSFFGQTAATKSGSGVVLSPDGYILTNNHVIDGYTKIEVSLPNDEQTYQASVVGADPTSDLAVIKIDAHNLVTAQFGDASGLRDGDWVIALGNALGLVEGGPTVTLGIVSGLGRSYTIGQSAYYDIIQTDAAINPGNSGGPLINLNGEVIGINTAKISSEDVSGVGFAISSDSARPVVDELITKGYVSRPYMGVSLVTVTSAIANYYGLGTDTGAFISKITQNGPASKAGLKAGDVITAIDGKAISTSDNAIKAIRSHAIGDTIEVKFYRGSDLQSASVTLSENPH